MAKEATLIACLVRYGKYADESWPDLTSSKYTGAGVICLNTILIHLLNYALLKKWIQKDTILDQILVLSSSPLPPFITRIFCFVVCAFFLHFSILFLQCYHFIGVAASFFKCLLNVCLLFCYSKWAHQKPGH